MSCNISITVEVLFCPVTSCSDHSVSLGWMFSDMYCISSTNLLILWKEEKADKKRVMWMNDQKRRKKEKVRKWGKRNKSENGKRQSKRREGMRVGKLRHRDGEKWCGNSHLLSCSPHPVPLSACLLLVQRKALQGQGGCWLSWKGQRGYLWLDASHFPVTLLCDRLVLMIQHYIFLLDPSLWATTSRNTVTSTFLFNVVVVVIPNVGLCTTNCIESRGRSGWKGQTH